jgi:hypothetical protein
MVRDWDYIRETYRQFRNRDDGGEAIFTLSKVPDYLNDLNAMHEAEKVLAGDQRSDYFLRVDALTEPHEYGFEGFCAIRATADQRAEAFLRTLNLRTNHEA